MRDSFAVLPRGGWFCFVFYLNKRKRMLAAYLYLQQQQESLE